MTSLAWTFLKGTQISRSFCAYAFVGVSVSEFSMPMNFFRGPVKVCIRYV